MSSQPGQPGVKMACENMRRVPASLLIFSRASYFMSLVRKENFSSTEYEPLMQATLVSLSRKISLK